MPPKIAFVTRATGNQGIAVTKNLIAKGYSINALVTNPNDARSTAYRALSPSSIKLFTGTLDDASALAAALGGCTALFLNLMPNFVKPGDEEQQGKAILDAAKMAGVKYVVHSTVLGLELFDEQEVAGNPGFAAAVLGKKRVEEAVRKSGIEGWTILRPGYFMTNFLTPLNDMMWLGIAKGEAVSSYRPTTILHLTDVNDIGAFAVAAFENPDKFNGKIIPLASQRLQVEEALSELRAAAGRDIKSVYRSDEESAQLAKTNPIVGGQLFLRDSTDTKVDIEELKKWGVQLGTFTQFLKREKEWVDRTFAATH